MKYLWLLTLLVFSFGSAEAQKKKKKSASTSKSKKSKKKIKTTGGAAEFDELICYEDGPCTFNMLRGDTLVYEVSATGKQYNLYVIPVKYVDGSVADFNWYTSAPDSKSGHIVISSTGLKSSKKYITYFPTGELKLTDASAIWLCGDNYSEITKKRTIISFDNNAAEDFVSPSDGDAATLPINYKGTATDLDGFIIETKPAGTPNRKEMWVMNISDNLLILKMDLGWTMTLKEVREFKESPRLQKKKKKK